MEISEIKKDFFCYRNGIVADALRKAGDPHTMIFGLDVPTLSAIARKTGYDYRLAELLWDDREVRESRLLAAWLFKPEYVNSDKAVALARDCRTREEADMLCFRLFKRSPQALEILQSLQADAGCRWAAESLERHLS